MRGYGVGIAPCQHMCVCGHPGLDDNKLLYQRMMLQPPQMDYVTAALMDGAAHWYQLASFAGLLQSIAAAAAASIVCNHPLEALTM